jgi:hypothetical protein
MCYF